MAPSLVDFALNHGWRGRGEVLLRTEKNILWVFCTPLLQNSPYCWKHPLFPSNSRIKNRVIFFVRWVGRVSPRIFFSVLMSMSMKGSTRKTGPVMLIRGANRKTHFYNRVSFSLGAVRGSEPENNSDLAEPLTIVLSLFGAAMSRRCNLVTLLFSDI